MSPFSHFFGSCATFETPLDVSQPHHHNDCTGNCQIHPLMNKDNFELTHYGWGDVTYYDELEALATETEEEKAARLAKQMAIEAAKKLDSESIRMEVYARDVAMKARMGLRKAEMPNKKNSPCKNLYYDEKNKKWSAKYKENVAPLMKHLTGSECWAHEYTDPKTKAHVCKHACPYQHPGDSGWHKEWATDRLWQPAAAPVHALVSAVRQQPQHSSQTRNHVERSAW